MPEGRVARVTEIIAGSPKSFEDAITVGFRRATKTLRGITGLKVKDMRAKVEDGKIIEYRVTLDVFFTRKIGAGLFGGEGFVLQKLTGPGTAFAELDGDAVEYHLQANEVMRVEPGHVAMFEATVAFDIEMVKGMTNILLGGAGVFLATLKGPGRIWLHSMTESKMALRLAEFMPAKAG